MREGCGSVGCRTVAADLSAWSTGLGDLPRFRAPASEAALELPHVWRGQLELHRQQVYDAETWALSDRLLAESGFAGPSGRGGGGSHGALARTDPTNPDDVLGGGAPVVDRFDLDRAGSPFGGQSDFPMDDLRDELEPPGTLPRPGDPPLRSGNCDLVRMQLPDYASATGGTGESSLGTHACFEGEYRGLTDWPPTDCEAPCYDIDPSCDPPTGASGVDFVVLTQGEIDAQGLGEYECEDADPVPGWVALGRTITADERAFLDSAVLLLQQNLDLVQWVACLAQAWSPSDKPDFVAGVRHRKLSDCLTDVFTGTDLSVYVVESLQEEDCDGTPRAPTGAATRRFDPTPDGNVGPVIPLGIPHWEDRLDVYLNGSSGAALCAVAELAGVMLHELVHLCFDTKPDCNCETTDCCWEEQRMVAAAFQWALTQRYPCLAATSECAMADPASFMSSCNYYGLRV